MRAPWLAACAAVAVALASASGAADPAGTADGTLELDDRPTALTHAYVIEVDELPEMHFGDGPTRYLKLLLTDRPFPDSRTPSDMAAHQLSFEGALRGVGLDIDATTGTVMSGRTLLPQAEGPQFFTVMTMNTEPMVVLEDWAEADGRLRGHVRTPEPLEVVNFDGDPNLPTAFSFDASFDAAIVRAPEIVETLEGPAARDSAQAAAVRRLIEAVAGRDLDGIKAALLPPPPGQGDITAEELDMMHAMMFQADPSSDAPAPEADPEPILARLAKVYLFDDGTAVAVLLEGESGASTFPMAEDGGTWRIGRR